MVRVIEGSGLKGNKNFFELARDSSYRGKNYHKCMREIEQKSSLIRVGAGSSYRESTVV